MPTRKRYKRKRPVRKQPPTLLILAGIALLLIAGPVGASTTWGYYPVAFVCFVIGLNMLGLIRIDLDRRPDVVQGYIIRAPSLVLLDEKGSVVWKQDEGLSDEAPLDREQVEVQVEALGQDL